MGKLTKKAYEEMIAEDILILEKYLPTYSLEKRHIIDVLKWSVNNIYNINTPPRKPNI